MKKKFRIDTLLVEKGYFETKNKAQAVIMAGDVKINGEVVSKAGAQFCVEDLKEVEIETMRYVSRGGYKLEKALECFNIDVKGKTCLDAGASTGGFTDCLIQNGADFVYAVDVGCGQIAWKLRQDEKVKVIERTNVKNCSVIDIYAEDDIKADFCVMDLSFISIKRVLPNLKTLLKDKFDIVALIKPQFEAGKDSVGKNGVVREKHTHIEVINSVMDFAKGLELHIQRLTFSPIKGPAGNIEYLVWISTSPNEEAIYADEIVENAFLTL